MIRGFELVTRRFELVTRGFELVTRGFELVTRGFELATRGFELVTRVLLFRIAWAQCNVLDLADCQHQGVAKLSTSPKVTIFLPSIPYYFI